MNDNNTAPPYYAPSILSADFSDLRSALDRIHSAGADWLHLDVMDGSFVPNISFGPKVVSDLRGLSHLPFDVHLMIAEPDAYVDQFIDAGADYLTFHLEAAVHAHRLIQRIHGRGVRAGISIVPSTPARDLDMLLPYLDLILVMTVNPGFGGQKMIPECLEKVRCLYEMKRKHGYSYLLSVDGGVSSATAEEVRKAGTDVLVSGSSFFKAEDPAGEVRLVRGR
jgi:ribulose-phosphate 3-epimerase